MERLTERDEFGNADITALLDVMPELYAGLSFAETNALTDALNRLAAYEDSGLEPNEVRNITNIDFYVRDKASGTVHRVGDEQHDSIWVDDDGELHFMNLQNGDGASGKSHIDDGCGYEFVPSDCGAIGSR